MKINPVKTIVSLVLAGLVGLLCYYFVDREAQETQKWMTFAIATVTMLFSFIMAFGVDYNKGIRNASILIVAYIGTVFALASNILFVCLHGPMIVYIVVTVLITLLSFLGVYGLNNTGKDKR